MIENDFGGETNDPMDDPRVEAQRVIDDERYLQELEKRERWAE